MDLNYNNSSSFQMNSFLNNKKLIFELIKKLIDNKIKLNKNLLKFKILDIGCSHGLNSNLQINEFINQIKSNQFIIEKLNDKKEQQELNIQVYHADIPENDFTKLFQILNKRNKNDTINVYSYGIGNSFYYQIVPNDSIDFIFSFFTLHWLVSENIESFNSFERSMIYGTFESRLPGLNDYKEKYMKIFENRLNELKQGGIFLCCFNVLFDELDIKHFASVERSFNNIKEILREMHYEGLLEKDEVSKMFVPMSSARKDEYEYAIDYAESKGLKLLNKSIQVVNYVELASLGKTFNSQDEQYIFSINAILSFGGGFIHSSFFGENKRKDSMFKEFKSRFFKKYKQNPKSFEFYLNILYLSF